MYRKAAKDRECPHTLSPAAPNVNLLRNHANSSKPRNCRCYNLINLAFTKPACNPGYHVGFSQLGFER